MRQSLQLKLGQHLTMTPQLQQAIRLLQLSSLDLQTEIQAVLDSNLMLERDEDSSDLAVSDDHDSLDKEIETSAEVQIESSSDSAEANTLERAKTETNEASVIETSNSRDEAADFNNSDTEVKVSETAPDELPVDSSWDDIYDSYDGATSYSRGDDDQQQSFEQTAASSESLHDYLRWQLSLTPFSDNDRMIAEAIIDGVDNNGYLAIPLEEIHESLVAELELEFDEVVAVLRRVQHFDPPGIAARDPGECLLLQLDQLPADTPWLEQARLVVENHLESLAGRDFNGLMRRLKVTQEELQQIVVLIQTLTPHPGTQLANNEAEYVIPDVFVYRQKDSWRVELNQENAPRLRINSQYSRLVRRADNSADNMYMKNDLQEARWFLKSLQNRNETVLRVATCIVEHQREFLEGGEEYMKPLVLRDIAEALDMHESTISRVTTQKYMHTPRGIYEFKYFFSSHVGTSEGGEASAVAIRAMIKKMINEENPRKPLSDSKIAKLLGDEGINIARRTVAKYREQMTIASSSDRKRLI